MIEEHSEPAWLSAKSGPQLIVLSARSEAGMIRTASSLAAWLERAESKPRLAEVAYTLQVGREAWNHRAAFLVANLSELRDKLADLAAGNSADIWRGIAERSGDQLDLAGDEEGRAYLTSLWQGGKLERLANLWLRGVAVNWQILERPAGLRRIALPPSPMEEARYWITAADPWTLSKVQRPRIENHAGCESPKTSPTGAPLNTPAPPLGTPRIVKHRLGADHPLLRDHRVRGQSILPGAGFLELAWEILADNQNHFPGQFKDIYWLQPIAGDLTGCELALELAETGTATELSLTAMPERTLCASARWQASPAVAPAALAIDTIQQRLSRQPAPERLYAQFSELGLEYGPHFQVISELWAGKGEALARLDLPATVPAGQSAPSLPASLLDGAMQTIIGILQAQAEEPASLYLPISLAALSVYGPLPSQVFAHATPGAGGKREFLDFDILVSAPDGRPLAKLTELVLRRVAIPAAEPATPAPAPAIGLVELAPVWQAAPVGKVNPPARVLLWDDDPDRGAAFDRLAGDTSALIRLNSGTGFAEPEPDRFVINPANPDDYSRLFEALQKRSLLPDAVLHAWPDKDPADGQAAAQGLLPWFLLIRAMIRARLQGKVRLLSTYVSPAPASRILPASLAGLLRTLAQEHPAYAAALVEHVGASNEAQAQTAWAELSALAFGAVEVRFADGERLVRGWQSMPAMPAAPVPLREQGVYMITGGAGGLGLIFARHLASRYRAQLVLTGRERLAGPRRRLVEGLREAGAEVVYIRADIAKPATMRRVVRVALLKFGRLDGVIHAAGLLHDGPLAGKDPAAVLETLRPKLAGTLVLELALREAGAAPEFLALFSSLAGAFGNPGQGDYATANRFLDAYAENRAGQTGPRVISINWPWWLEGGMAMPKQSRQRLRELVGLDPLDTATGLASFEAALAGLGWQRVVGQGDVGKILASLGGMPAAEVVPVAAVSDSPACTTPVPSEPGAPLAVGHPMPVALPALQPATTTKPDNDQVRAAARDFLVTQLAAELKLPVEKIQPDAPLEKYGIDSFLVLKLTRTLEATFGNLPKTLFFEYLTLASLADYFAVEHAERLREVTGLMAPESPAAQAGVVTDAKPVEITSHNQPQAERGPWLLDEAELAQHPELAQTVTELLVRHGHEAAFAVNRAVLAPQLFIAADLGSFFYLNRSADAIFVWTYVGPVDGYGALIQSLNATLPKLPLDILTAGEEARALRDLGFTTTPIGTHQANQTLDDFNLNGGSMRRLRYQVTHYGKAGQCRTEEYRPGQNAATDAALLQLTADWVALKEHEPPFLAVFRAAVRSGRLSEQHRLFLTWRGEGLDSAIAIAQVPRLNGYLMDLEFYRGDLPLGGLEYAICRIIETLRTEGCRYFSLGATLGTALEPCGHEDPAVLTTLQQLHEAGMFNGDKNLQFKNKFRFEARPLFLCRPRGSDPASVLNLMLLLSNPTGQRDKASMKSAKTTKESETANSTEHGSPSNAESALRQAALSAAGWNVLRLSAVEVPFDLKTDSWSELDTGYVRARLSHLAGLATTPLALEDALRGWFPFPHILPVAQGRQAEAALLRALGKPGGKVLQNPLFPTWIYHQIDRDLQPLEIPVGALSLDKDSEASFPADLDLTRLERILAEGAALVVVELANNALGGYPVSLANLQEAYALSRRYGVPLFLDATRALENAAFIRAQDSGWADQPLLDILHALCAQADGLTASLGKDFGCNTGGLLACHDLDLYQRCREYVQSGGSGLPVVSRALLASACSDVAEVEAGVLARIARVRTLAGTLARAGLPVLNPPGGHGVMLDIARLPAVQGLKQPIPAFLAALYVATGIRAGAHSTGLGKPRNGSLWVRLALPVGLDEAAMQAIGERLVAFLKGLDRLHDLALVTRGGDPLGDFTAEFTPVDEPKVDVDQTVTAPRQDVSRVGPVGQGISAHPTTPTQNICNNEPIAIIGAAGRYPHAEDLEAFWDVLSAGRDCITEVPPERWDYRQHTNRDGKIHTRWAGFIGDHDKFDARFFNILPLEAENLDPQERLFLEIAWAALEDAGYTRDRLRADPEARRMGVFTGVVWSLYALFGAEEGLKGNVLAPSSFHWSIPNRVSYFFDLEGPSLAVDTACSASLTALHLACESLRRGECATALVGGVNLELHPNKGLLMDHSGMTSSEGKCRSFGAGGDGYVPGEGVGAVLIKPLSAALRDGDRIDCLILATATNHGGKTNGYSVPNPNAQARLIASALRKAGVDPRTLGYVEAHGTGTALGDPIEVAGLTKAFREWTADNGFCALGSVKTNIGHLEAAAGIAGLTKLLLQFRHRRLVPSLHAETLNPHIEFAKTPFHVQRELSEWRRPIINGEEQPRRAALSSFGAGGANAHVLLEEFVPAQSALAVSSKPVVLVLSARDEKRVHDYVGKLLASLRRWAAAEHPPSLSDIAYTLQMRREAFPARLALVTNGIEQAIDKIAAFLAGKGNGVYTGKARDGVSPPSVDASPEVLAQAFVAGAAIDWASCYSTTSPCPVALPTYPFARKRFWLSISDNTSALPPPAHGPAALHPLLDHNVSGFGGVAFEKSVRLDAFYLHDHRISGQPVLPGVAYLEMARAAGALAAGRPVAALSDVVWIRPVEAGEAPVPLRVSFNELNGTTGFEVRSAAGVHAQGKLWFDAATPVACPISDVADLRARCARDIPVGELYEGFKASGLDYGPAFRALRELRCGDAEALARLALPVEVQAGAEDFTLHPSLMDGALQAVAALMADASGTAPYVPFSLGRVEVYAPLPPVCYAHVIPASSTQSPTRRFDVVILDEAGRACVSIRQFGVRLLPTEPKLAVSATGPHAKMGANSPVLYAVPVWRPAVLPEPRAAALQTAAPVLVLDQCDSIYTKLLQHAARMEWHRGDLLLVQPGEHFKANDEWCYRVRPDRPEDYAQLIESLHARQLMPATVLVFGLTMDMGCPAAERSVKELRALFLFTQALAQDKPERDIRILYIGPSGLGTERLRLLAAAAGFGASVALEQRRLAFSSLDLPGDSAEEWIDSGLLVNVLTRELGAPIHHGGAIRYQPTGRFRRGYAELAPLPAANLPVRDGGTYLITGGLGGLGLICAEALAQQARVNLALASRSNPSPAQAEALARIQAKGLNIANFTADVGAMDSTEALIHQVRERFGGLDGVLHAAGLIRDAALVNKAPDDFEAVLLPKILGATHLDLATRDLPLDFFALFSSIAALGGNHGQCDYAAANAYLDALAAHRDLLRQRGERHGRTVAINWCLWEEGGMNVPEATRALMVRSTGLSTLDRATGVDALARCLAADTPQVAVLTGDASRLKQHFGLVGPDTEVEPTSPQISNSPTAVSQEKLIALAEQGIVKIFVEFLKVGEEEIDLDVEFADYGIDSIMMIRMLNQFEEVYEQVIDPNAMLEYNTIRKLARHIVQHGILRAEDMPADTMLEAAAVEAYKPVTEINADAGANGKRVPQVFVLTSPTPPFSGSTTSPSPDKRRVGEGFYSEAQGHGFKSGGHEPIAVIGLACRFPKSPSPELFWENLAAGRNLITEVPTDRWPMERWFSPDKDAPGKSYSKWGGFIDDVDKFDARFFKLSVADAVTMDPQQRILLELTRELLDRSGYRSVDVAGTRTAVLIGGGMNSYCASGIEHFNEQEMSRIIVNRCTNMMAARLSDFFNLTGPSQTLDTACSSSLVAIHQACQVLRSGEANAAIVGGIDLLLDPFFHIGFSKAGVLSDDCNSYVFDERAAGFVIGEGAGLVMLKPLSQARRDGDQIHALILGSAINNDGHTMGITVPNIEGQKTVIEAALNEAGVSPESISYLEAHGTGTLLGDPIEIKAATQIYRRHTDRTGYCAVGSVKSNMGHLLRAAGVASFIKVVLSMEHGRIPPTLNCQNPHPRFRFHESPFYPVTTARDWALPPGERRAAISSFGFGGTNCHVILQGVDPRDSETGRPSLPVTQFNRQRYWKTGHAWGRSSCSVPSVAPTDTFYRSLLLDLRAGRVDAREALALSRQMGAQT